MKLQLLIEELFKKKVPYTYVADGHHRTAAAALVVERKEESRILDIRAMKSLIIFLPFIFLIISLK